MAMSEEYRVKLNETMKILRKKGNENISIKEIKEKCEEKVHIKRGEPYYRHLKEIAELFIKIENDMKAVSKDKSEKCPIGKNEYDALYKSANLFTDSTGPLKKDDKDRCKILKGALVIWPGLNTTREQLESYLRGKAKEEHRGRHNEGHDKNEAHDKLVNQCMQYLKN